MDAIFFRNTLCRPMACNHIPEEQGRGGGEGAEEAEAPPFNKKRCIKVTYVLLLTKWRDKCSFPVDMGGRM